MKVALVHDLLTQLGGAERVLDCFLEMFPNAPVFTLLYDAKATENRYANRDIRVSFLQKFPQVWSYKWYFPFMRRAVESFDLSGFNLVVSDASAFAKGVKVPPAAPHVCYCHTPTRYLWSERKNYVASLPYPNVIKWGVQPWLGALKKWDYWAAQKVTRFVANSQEVRSRIAKYYRRDAPVVYPPVDTVFFQPGKNVSRDFFLTAGRLEPYKKTELVLQAFMRLKWPLVVAGSGSTALQLKNSYRAANIQFLGRVSDQRLRALYQNARAFIFPAKEDSGMMVVESLACGTPVVAYGAGGALEFLEQGRTGLFFAAQTSESLLSTLANFHKFRFIPEELRQSAQKYSKSAFKAGLSAIIRSTLSYHA